MWINLSYFAIMNFLYKIGILGKLTESLFTSKSNKAERKYKLGL